jgi:hypothetical protein
MNARGLFAGLTLAALALASLGCGPGAPPPDRTTRRETGPQWQDVFDGTPEVYAVFRPQAIKRDEVYGALFKTVLHMAQARTAMRGVTSLEALEGCDEIVIGIRKDQQGEDAAMIFRGVPASLDPTKMTDATGSAMLRLVDTKAKVPEYEWVDRQSAANGSLFILPDRTWVGTLGEARGRARQAFASPFGRPAPKADPRALASVRFDAAAFLNGPRFTKSSVVGPLTRKLRALTLALMPGKAGLIATLQYMDEDASAIAEMHLKRVLEDILRASPPGPAPNASSSQEPPRRGGSLEWLKTAQVTHDGSAVIVKVAIPARLLEDLPNATGNDLPL